MYFIDDERIKKKAEVRIGDKVYGVDNRLSTFLRLTKRLDEEGDEMETIISESLGKAAFDEIIKRDYSYPVMKDIAVMCLAAMQEIEVSEMQARFRK